VEFVASHEIHHPERLLTLVLGFISVNIGSYDQIAFVLTS